MERRIAEIERQLEVQEKLQMFDGSNLIILPRFLPALQMRVSTGGIHEGAAMWLFHSFTRKREGAALNVRHVCPVQVENVKNVI